MGANKIVQVAAWFAVVLVLGNIVTYDGRAAYSASCLLAPGLCGHCGGGCGDYSTGYSHGLLDAYAGMNYHFPITQVLPTYSFNYYQNPVNYGGFNGQTTVFSTTTTQTTFSSTFYNYQYYDPCSGWSYQKNAIYAGGEELYSRQQFGW
jgi:hypothetical protein